MTNPTAHGVSVFDGLVDAPSDLSAAIARVRAATTFADGEPMPDGALPHDDFYCGELRTLIAAAERAAGQPAPASEPQAAAARDVLAERARQISVEGWTPEHDDRHDGMELAFAASCYAVADEGEPPSAVWPWSVNWWKPRSHRKNLVRAGALILAEIERLDRAAHAKEHK